MSGVWGFLAEIWIIPFALGLILMFLARPLARFMTILHEDGLCLALKWIGFALIILGIAGAADSIMMT